MSFLGEGFPSTPYITISTYGIEKLLTDLKPQQSDGVRRHSRPYSEDGGNVVQKI